jgi:hypothetical protein
MEVPSSTRNMMKKSPTTAIGQNLPNIAVRISMEYIHIQFCELESIPTPGEKLDIDWQTHLLKYVYKWLPIGETLLRIDSTVLAICPSCTKTTETHNHIFQCTNTHCCKITTECLAQIEQINLKWQLPTHLTFSILSQLRAWVSNKQSSLDMSSQKQHWSGASVCFTRWMVAPGLYQTFLDGAGDGKREMSDYPSYL